MSFIDSTYFTGEINISQASTLAPLTQAITQYEKEILISLLGYKLYSLLIADLSEGVPQTQIYKDLVDGAEFTHEINGEEILLKWEGLKNTSLQSLIAYYVYYMYVERGITSLTGTGISLPPKGKDWERVSPVNKLCDVWERMRQLYGKIPIDYKSYGRVIADELGVFNCDPSAYNFLLTNVDDYPDWIFTPIWNINVFGI